MPEAVQVLLLPEADGPDLTGDRDHRQVRAAVHVAVLAEVVVALPGVAAISPIGADVVVEPATLPGVWSVVPVELG